MQKKVIIAGFLGGLMLFVWTFVVNGIFGFQASIDMKPIPGEGQVYETLKENIVQPGRYICNPELTPEGRYPGEEPVFSVLYGGMGHESAGRLMLVGLAAFFLTPMIGAWMLSQTSRRVLSSYPRKVLFFVAFGLVLGILSDLTSFGIGGYPLKDAFLLAVNDVVAWTLAGLVIAWWINAVSTEMPDSAID